MSELPDPAVAGAFPRSPSPSRHRHGQKAVSSRPQRFRSVWISDVHLGTKACKAAELAAFLAGLRCDHLFLVGDIVDGWQIKRRWYWSQDQSRAVREILRKTEEQQGCRVVYVTGNHDEFLRGFPGLDLSGIRVVPQVVHETADGRRLLVLHGDQFDAVVACHRWLAHLGDWAYQLTLVLNRWFDGIRRRLGYGYWSLSGYLKKRVKDAVAFIGRYEDAVATAARRRGVDGVVCGHIHHAELREIDGFLYANDGDWVESCTALVEHVDGRLELLYWYDSPESERLALRARRRTPVREPHSVGA